MALDNIYLTQEHQSIMADLSKYADNQFDAITTSSLALMGEILADTRPRLALAQSSNAGFTSILASLDAVIALWNPAETIRANAEAALPAATYSFRDKLAGLVRRPDADTNSIMEVWLTTVRGQVAYQSPAYYFLIPNGREMLTKGSAETLLDKGRDFGIRLSQQTLKPALVALGVTVTAFYNAARALRTAQITAKSAIETALAAIEPIRFQAASVLYSMVGTGMVLWGATPSKVDTLFDVSLLRPTTQTVPAAPVDRVWAPSDRKLSTMTMPNGATRLEAWRESPGGMPELLAIGKPRELFVEIPATITFTTGDLYQLWLQARNSRGSSPAGPKENWAAT